MLGEQQLCNNFGVASVIDRKGIDYFFDDVRPIFNDGDIVFGNLECTISSEKAADGQDLKYFCAQPGVVKGLKSAHFNMLSVANNHIMEHEGVIFQNTVRLLRDNGILPVGITDNIEIINIKGYKIAFMAYSFIEDNNPNSCYNKISSEEPIIIDVQKIRSLVDVIIISLHWGFEYVPYPSPEQILIGRKIIDAGADVILGGHPHVTQSYEIYKNRPIIYSLGNFVFDQTYIPTTRESFIAEICFSDTFDVVDVSIIPIIINKIDYRPEIVRPPRSDIFLKSVNEVRKLIENRSISDFQTSIGDYKLLTIEYKKAAKRKMKTHFMRNIHRYSLSTVFDIIKRP
jgi:gamma-polyglutamate biosynthesis protein CapA